MAAEINATLDQLAAVAQALAVLREVSPRTLDVDRRDGRAAQLADRRRGAERRRHSGRMGGRAPGDRDERRPSARDAAHGRNRPRAARDGRCRARREAGTRCSAGSSAPRWMATRPRLAGAAPTTPGALVGAGIGAREIQIWTDVDGMLLGRSTRHQTAPSRAEAVVRRGRGARVFRREGAASEHDPASRRAGHPGAHPQLDAA